LGIVRSKGKDKQMEAAKGGQSQAKERKAKTKGKASAGKSRKKQEKAGKSRQKKRKNSKKNEPVNGQKKSRLSNKSSGPMRRVSTVRVPAKLTFDIHISNSSC
jgi:hypothetical protein